MQPASLVSLCIEFTEPSRNGKDRQAHLNIRLHERSPDILREDQVVEDTPPGATLNSAPGFTSLLR